MTEKLFYQFVRWYDALWRRRNNVERFDQLISLSLESFAGERIEMNDGTWIEPGDHVAVLHFNHDCFYQMEGPVSSYTRGALQFRKLLFTSLEQLSQRIERDAKFEKVKAFHGVSWLPPHGKKIGFMIERLPNTLINRARKIYFRVLLKTFFPALAARNNPVHPHGYWLTRNNLLKYFSGDSCVNEI